MKTGGSKSSPFTPTAPATGRPSSSLRAGRKTLALLVDHIDNFKGGYERQLRETFESACERLDMNLLLVVAGGPEASATAHGAGVSDLVGPDCADGIIVLGATLAHLGGADTVARFLSRFQPLPLCSLGLAVPGVPSVVVDQRAGMRALMDHLIAHHGRRRIAFLGGPAENPDAQLRHAIYRESLTRYGIGYEADLVTVGDFTPPTGAEGMARILERGVASIDAVVAGNDGMAIGAIDWLREHGLRVPRDVLVTGFDDLLLSRLSSPPLSTVHQPLDEIALLAMKMVLDQMHGVSVPERAELPVEFMPRQSCGCDPIALVRARRKAIAVVTEPRGEGRGDAASLLRDHADRIAETLKTSVRIPDRIFPDWPLRLVRALAVDLEGQGDAFAATLEKLLDGIRERNDLYEQVQIAISILRDELAAGASPDLEELWHTSRRLIAVANTRSQASQRLEMDNTYRRLLRSGERFSASLDLAAFKEALADELPALKLRNVGISLFHREDRRELIPFFCMHEGVPFEPAEPAFGATMLAPAGIHGRERRHTSFVLPLGMDQEQIGVVVFESTPGTAALEMLRDQICGALRNAALHREIVQKTALHERSVQERIATTKRMSALSVLAGGVAHDLNNALGPLVALSDVVLHEIRELRAGRASPSGEVEVDLETIKLASLRASQTIKDLLTLARKGRAPKQAVDLNQAVLNCIGAKPLASLRDEIDIRLELSTEPQVIAASEPHVVRAISNLLRNAGEAIDGAGTVIVRTGRAVLEQPMSGYEQVEPGDYAVLSVSDDGKGIPGADLGRVFEPFFTSKKRGNESGSGLGLAIVHGVVKEHDGFVDVVSTVGAGTTFTLYFPRTGEPCVYPDELHGLPRGRARLLVLDDEVIQLRTASRVLGRLGYEVDTAQRGAEAYELFVRAKARTAPAHYASDPTSPYDLVIFDALLNEEQDGLLVFEQIRALYPRQKGLAVSGHAPTERGKIAMERGLPWLTKPYTVNALAHAVQAALASRAPAALSPVGQ